MKVTFLGAAGTVTGSKYLVEAGGQRILVDCGLYQGFKQLRLRNWDKFSIPPASIDAVVLTHAHIDHTGYLPVLVRDGFGGPVYCTPPTDALSQILLPDAGFLEERDAERANRYGYSKHRPALPLFTEADARVALTRLQTADYEQRVAIGDVGLTFHYGGHLLGAAIVSLATPSGHIVFSGDLGRNDDAIMRPPVKRPVCDVLVVESTYGDRLHGEAVAQEQLAELLPRVAGRGGSVLIPSFAVGRSQTLLYHLQKLYEAGRVPRMPVFLDSPMAIDATAIFERFRREHRLSAQQTRAVCSLPRLTRTADESKAIAATKVPVVILSASGMATGGRVLHHLEAMAPDRRNAIVLAGFQSPGTRGASLEAGAKEIKVHGNHVPVAAEVLALRGVSSHADQNGLMAWLRSEGTAPRHCFLTHGEPAAADALRRRIQEELGWNCVVPAYRDAADLQPLSGNVRT